MTITEMHVIFRQYAQQMGMQNVRAILPEQIDLLLNSSISDNVNNIIRQSVGITNDRIITDNSKIGQINALSTLYKVLEIEANPDKNENDTKVSPFEYKNKELFGRITANINDLKDGGFTYLFLVDMSINYIVNYSSSSSSSSSSSNKTKENSITTYFPVRLIDDGYLADTLNDFILKPRLRSPISVIYNNQIDIYIDDIIENSENSGVLLPQKSKPNTLRLSYIAKPAKVQYLSDLGGNNVDCDLPDYMHEDVVRYAVNLYNTALTGNIATMQGQQQNQQREDTRNNTNPYETQQQ